VSAVKKLPTKKTTSRKVRQSHALVGAWIDPEEKIWVPARYNHPLAGTWKEVENNVLESSATFEIAVVDGQFVVSGTDVRDGTKFRISSVRWDGEKLHFTSVFPPTGHRVKHVVQAIKPGLMKHWITYTDVELWRRRGKRCD